MPAGAASSACTCTHLLAHVSKMYTCSFLIGRAARCRLVAASIACTWLLKGVLSPAVS